MHAQPDFWNGLDSIYRTVAVVDLVGYSSLARMLEENMGAAAVAELNRRIQDLIQEALSPLPSCSYTLIAKTGDGALVLFEDAPCAHQFAVELHQCAARHNTARTDKSAQRSFRIGVASGEINVVAQEYAGITIANAVRLETAAKPGEILVDLATFDKLPPAAQGSYSSETTVRGKRDECFRVRKWKAGGAPAIQNITRRRALAVSLGAAASVGLGYWGVSSPHIVYRLHPLPSRRWVAFAAWPVPSAELAAVVREMLSSVRQGLARLESVDHAFSVVETEDSADGEISGEPLTPLKAAHKYGATLALLAASEVKGAELWLSLQVVDPVTERRFRHCTLASSMAELPRLREKLLAEVAALLDLPERMTPLDDEHEIANLPPEAYRLFAEGKSLGGDFNGPRRQEGIEKLQSLVNSLPQFSVGYGELAGAYIEDFRTGRDPMVLDLAKTNAAQALRLNPDSSVGLLSSAKVATAMGKTDDASGYLRKLFAKDPHNPDALLYQAFVYRELGDAQGEMRAYKQILDSSPNNWRAYVERGRYFQEHARYAEAINAFQKANRIARNVALPLTNLGTVYQETKQIDAAREAYEQSVALFPTADAYMGLGTIAFGLRNYNRALEAYRNALKLAPRSHDLYRDIGDCQTMLGQSAASKASFEQARALLSEELKINPRTGPDWMLLSLYHAKVGAFKEAANDVATAERRGASDLGSQLTKAQTLVLLGDRDDALQIVLACLHKGLSPADVAIAVDLRAITSDPRYIKAVQLLPST